MKDSMTKNFRKGVLSSHKPLIGLPEAHKTPMHQENSPIKFENFSSPKNSKNQFLLDQISPEPTGVTKQPLTRLQSSQEAKLQRSRILSNSRKRSKGKKSKRKNANVY